jgi:hypothetical protein
MSDSLRKDETLTTADIAGRSAPTPRQARSEAFRGPVPVPVPDRTDRIAPDTETVQVPSTERDKGSAAGTAPPTALFPDDELHNFRARWDQVQTSFVDEPRRAVEQADGLVANVIQRIAEQFSNERTKLEEHWSKGENVNTEELRQALRQYRSFFDRLLSF